MKSERSESESMVRRVFPIAAAPILASMLALMLLPGSAISQGLTTKVMVDARHEKVVSELEEAGASVIARRGACVVMAVPSGLASAVLSSSGVVVRNDFDEIRLSRQTLSATGARIVQYVPQNAYLLWAPSEETTGALRGRPRSSTTPITCRITRSPGRSTFANPWRR
ncbi:MAG: hypothetical protein CL933_15430, partial [Deltaproteobacteria bacterium]|nr:hypothetical protein [Deltaproteobacteria bacterium]